MDLLTVGCTVLTDKSGTKLALQNIIELADLDSVHMYSWGSTTLVFVYRQL